MKEHFIIHSPSARGYWSNECGWVSSPGEADRFSYSERQRFYLPLVDGNDARWVSTLDSLPVYSDD